MKPSKFRFAVWLALTIAAWSMLMLTRGQLSPGFIFLLVSPLYILTPLPEQSPAIKSRPATIWDVLLGVVILAALVTLMVYQVNVLAVLANPLIGVPLAVLQIVFTYRAWRRLHRQRDAA